MKTVWLQIRVTEREKEEIKLAAAEQKMSMSEYMLMLHRQDKARKEVS